MAVRDVKFASSRDVNVSGRQAGHNRSTQNEGVKPSRSAPSESGAVKSWSYAASSVLARREMPRNGSDSRLELLPGQNIRRLVSLTVVLWDSLTKRPIMPLIGYCSSSAEKPAH